MSRGIFSHNRRRVVGALGASSIPGECWDKAGFKDCHGQQWRTAKTSCETLLATDPAAFQSKFPSLDHCLEQVTDKLTFENCIPKICPQKKASAGMSSAVRLALIAGGVVIAIKLLPVFLPSR